MRIFLKCLSPCDVMVCLYVSMYVYVQIASSAKSGSASSSAADGGEDDMMMDMMDGHDDEGAGAAATASTAGAKKSAKSAIAVAKAKILKTVSKQHLVDHILPVLSSLKHVLEAARSSAQVMNDSDEHHDDDDRDE